MKTKQFLYRFLSFVMIGTLVFGLIPITAAAESAETDKMFLLQENFDSYGDVTLTSGSNASTGIYFQQNATTTTAYIKDGRLHLDGSTAKSAYDTLYFEEGLNWTDYTVEADMCVTENTGWTGLLYRVVNGKTAQKAGINFTNQNKATLNGFTDGAWVNDVSGVNKNIIATDSPSLNEMFRIKIIANGNSSEFWTARYDSDGNLGEYTKQMAISNIPDTHLSGSVGMMLCNGAKSAVWMDNVTVYCERPLDEPEEKEPTILYQENFDSYTGKTNFSNGVNYSEAGSGWIYGKNTTNGYAYVENGKLHFSGGKYDVLYRDGGQTWGNYTVEADISYGANAQDKSYIGLMFNVHSATKFQKGSVAFSTQRASLNGYDSGWTNNDTTNKIDCADCGINNFSKDTHYRLKISVFNSTAVMYYAEYTDGVLGDWIKAIEIDNIPKDAQTGSIGFMTSTSGIIADVVIDNILVYTYSDISFSEDFDSYGDVTLASGSNASTGIYFQQNTTNTSAYIKDGRLYLDASTANSDYDTLYFETGLNWTDYTVEADYCIKTSTGWQGLLYRAVSGTSAQKAGIAISNKNKVSLNGFTAKGSWANNVSGTNTGIIAVDPPVKDEVFRMKVVVNGNSSELWTARYGSDGKLGEYTKQMAISNIPDAHLSGSVGMMLSSGAKSAFWIDNVTVSRGEDRMTERSTGVADIYEPVSGIVNPPVAIEKVTSALPAGSGKTPAIAFMEIDAQMNILDESGNKIATADEFMKNCSAVIIPAFVIDSQAEATALQSFFKTYGIIDAFVVADSENAALVKDVRMAYGSVRGALIFDSLDTDEKRTNARALVNDNMSFVAISRAPIDEKTVTYFNVRQIATWSFAENKAGVYTAIANGYTGVIADSASTIYDVYESITTPTVSGQPIIIAHRGAHIDTPENTIMAFHEAEDVYGAQAVETDIRISTDGVVFLMHDATVDRTTNGTGNNLEMTWDELNSLVVDEKASYGEDKISEVPRLDEVFEEFKDSDLVFYCHINAKTDAAIEAFCKLVDEYDFNDRVVFFLAYDSINKWNHSTDIVSDGISFTAGNYQNLLTSASNDLEAITNFLTNIVPVNYQSLFYHYNSYATESFYYQMSARGFVNSHSITNGQATLDDTLLTDMGAVGVLTDQPNNTDDYHYYIEAEDQTLEAGQPIDLQQTVHRIAGSEKMKCNILRISGPMLVSAEDSLTSKQTGELTAVYYSDITTEGGSTYRVYSEPVTITFTEPAPKHNIIYVEGQDPTYEGKGRKDFYMCDICGAYFEDADGEKPIDNIDEWMVIPALEVPSVSGDGTAATLAGDGTRRVYWGYIGTENTEYKWFNDFKAQCGDTFTSEFDPKTDDKYPLEKAGYYRFVVNYIDDNGKSVDRVFTFESGGQDVAVPAVTVDGNYAVIATDGAEVNKLYYGYIGETETAYAGFDRSVLTEADFSVKDGDTYLLNKAGYYRFVVNYKQGDRLVDKVYTVKVEQNGGVPDVTYADGKVTLSTNGVKVNKLYLAYNGEEAVEVTSWTDYCEKAIARACYLTPSDESEYTLANSGCYTVLVNYFDGNKNVDKYFTINN